MKCKKGDLADASVSGLAVTVAVLIVLFLATHSVVQQDLDTDVLAVNLVELFIGIFCLFSSFYLQFAPKLKYEAPKLDFKYTPKRQPRRRFVIAFFLMGVSYTLSSLRLFVPARDLGIQLQTWGVFIAATFFVLMFMGVIVFESNRKE